MRLNVSANDIDVSDEMKVSFWLEDHFKRSSLYEVIVDAKVRHEAITRSTDSRLLERNRWSLVQFVQQNGLGLRQNFNR